MQHKYSQLRSFVTSGCLRRASELRFRILTWPNQMCKATHKPCKCCCLLLLYGRFASLFQYSLFLSQIGYLKSHSVGNLDIFSYVKMTVGTRSANLTQIGTTDYDRFVALSTLLSLIDPVRGKPTRNSLDENPDGDSSGGQQLKQLFLDSFALICSTSGSGAESASAVCLEQHVAAKATLRMARNRGFTPDDVSGLERILQVLRVTARKGTCLLHSCLTIIDKIGGADRTPAQAEAEILSLVVELDKARIISLANKIRKGGIQNSLKEAHRRIGAGQVKLKTLHELGLTLWLKNCPFTFELFQTWNHANLTMLIDWASQCRWLYAALLPDLLGFDLKEEPHWLNSLRKIARYRTAIISMVRFAMKQPEVFADIHIEELKAPNSRRFSLDKEKTPLLASVKRLVNDELMLTMERLEKHMDTKDAEAHFRKACRLRMTLHAEMQLIVFYEANPSLVPRMTFIGTSKKACFLCHEYLRQHPLRLQVSACHQKVYPSWMPPPYYPLAGEFKSKPFLKLSKHIEHLATHELKYALNTPRRPRNQDSTAGPSLTISETQLTEWRKGAELHFNDRNLLKDMR